MTLNWLDRIGDWNPQLLRELKGRFKQRNVLLVVGLTILAQFLLIEFFWAQLPSADRLNDYNSYCVMNSAYDCLKDASGNIAIEWHRWWQDLFRVLNWGLLLLPIFGVYLLVANLGQEERRGTLNFIRLSPQSSRSILVGKLLGTPILLYLGMLLFVPLHLIVASAARVPVTFMVSFYLMLITSCCLLYSAALLYSFLGKTQPAGQQSGEAVAVIYMLITLLWIFPCFVTWNIGTVWSSFQGYLTSPPSYDSSDWVGLEWFYLPLSRSLVISHIFTLLNLGIMTTWVWRSLQRCFHTPNATPLNKQQSYGLILYLEVLTLGFCLQSWQSASAYQLPLMIVVCSITFVAFLALISILSNHRQTLLDWTRYRHMEARQQNKKSWTRSAALRDMIWGEKSPAVLAIALNFLLATAVVAPWILSWSPELNHQKSVAFLGLLLTFNLILIYAAIAQLMLLMKTPKRGHWASGMLGLAVLLPTLVGGILSAAAPQANALLLFSPFFWVPLLRDMPSHFEIYLTILGEWLMFGMLTLKLTQQLNRLGESASKSLLTGQVSNR